MTSSTWKLTYMASDWGVDIAVYAMSSTFGDCDR